MPKSKLTKAKEITQSTKQKVLDRQHNRSISGVYLYPQNTEFHHVITRGCEGIGYEWNIVALTSEEHRWVHDKAPILVYGRQRYTYIEFEILMKNHLKLNYENWSKANQEAILVKKLELKTLQSELEREYGNGDS